VPKTLSPQRYEHKHCVIIAFNLVYVSDIIRLVFLSQIMHVLLTYL